MLILLFMLNEINIVTAARQEITSPSGTRDYRQLIELFLSEFDRKESTKKTYRNSLLRFFLFIETTGRSLDNLSRKDIIDFKNDLLTGKEHHTVLTVSTYISAIKQFYRWAEAEKLYPNIAAGITLPRNREYFIKEHLTKEECLQLFEYLLSPASAKEHKHTFESQEEVRLRNYAMIFTMLWTGLRTIEVSRLDVCDITTKSGVRVLRVWGKGRDGKDDFVPLPDDVYDKIMDYLRVRSVYTDNDPLFAAEGYGSKGGRLTTRRIQQICKESLRGIGLDGHAYSAHSLRHTTAVQILLNGGDMYDVFYTLRHVDPAVSQKYVKSIEQERRLQMSGERFLKKAFTE